MLTFDNDVKTFIQITGTDIYNGYPKVKSASGFWSDRMLSVISQEQH